MEQFGDPEIISPAMAVLPALIAKSSICYNPLIYVGMNSQVRGLLELDLIQVGRFVLRSNYILFEFLLILHNLNFANSSKQLGDG